MMSMLALLLASCPALVLSAGSAPDVGNVEARLAELEEVIKAQQKGLQRQLAQIHELEDHKSNRRLDGHGSDKDRNDFYKAINDEKKKINDMITDGNFTDKIDEKITAPYNEKASDQAVALDHIYLICAGALVMFMQAGFAMVESGCCRSKNVQNILLKNLTDVCVGTLGWWAFGCSFAYGNPDTDGDGKMDNKFMGTEGFFGMGYLETDDNGLQTPAEGNKMLMWFFQWAFCSAASTIVSGGVAERVKFPGYVIYSFLMTAFIYPCVVAWTWGYGWLHSMNDIGFMDFAGSGIVHMTGGVGALVGAAVSGPRKGRWENPDEFVPHSMPLVVLGTFILWFGWYGFNCGSTLALSDESTGEWAAHVAMNTTIAAATCGLVVFLLRAAILRGYYDIGGFCNGILAGLVSITAGCANTDCGGAFVIALIGGFVYQGASVVLKKLRVDDPIDAFAVHGACGAWGVWGAALFDWGKGVDYANGWSGFDCNGGSPNCNEGMFGQQLAANTAEIFAIAGWVGGLSLLIFLPLRVAGLLRADDEVQDLGMDSAKHSPSKAYTIDQKEVNKAPRVTMQVLDVPKSGSPEHSPVSPVEAPAQEEEVEVHYKDI